MTEADPNGLDAHSPGAKLDAGKPKPSTYVLRYFPRAILEVAKVSEFGAKKYTPKGWEKVTNGVDRYEDAEVRHILKEEIERSQTDLDSDILHAAHKAWNALASLELLCRTSQSTLKPLVSTSGVALDLSSSQPVPKMEKQDGGVPESTPSPEKFTGQPNPWRMRYRTSTRSPN